MAKVQRAAFLALPLSLALLLFASPAAAPPAALMTPGDVDHLADALWATAGVSPAPAASDEEFLRRVSIDVIGRIPTPEEAERFLADAGADKRTRLVEQLL